MNNAYHLLTSVVKETLNRNPQEALDALNQCLIQNNVELRETEEGVYLAYFKDAVNCETIESSESTDSTESSEGINSSEIIDSPKNDNPPLMNIASSVWAKADQNTKASLMTFDSFRKTKEERIKLAEKRIDDIKALTHTINLLNPNGEVLVDDIKTITSSLTVLNESSRILTIKKSLMCLYIATIYTAIVDANSDMLLQKAKELVFAICQIDCWRYIARGIRFIALLRISPAVIFYPEIASSHLLEKASKESFQAAVLCLKEVHRDLLPAHHQVPLLDLKHETQVLP
ncbi:hypothetical protein CU098_011651, partial [Rhizopus stolonifer]